MDLVIFNPSEDDKRLIMRDSTHMEKNNETRDSIIHTEPYNKWL